MRINLMKYFIAGSGYHRDFYYSMVLRYRATENDYDATINMKGLNTNGIHPYTMNFKLNGAR